MRADRVPGTISGRVHVFDIARGLCVLSMVAFHYCYDLTELAGVDLAWFKPPFEDVWRATISWSFLFIAGIMCSFSRDNLRRGARYAAVAIGVWLATTAIAVDVPISFGIIFCMAASTLLYACLQKIGAQPRGVFAAALLAVAFLMLLEMPSGSIGFGNMAARLPRSLYATEWFSWLGFPGPAFASGDYYPLLPYCLMYLAGASLGPHIRRKIAESPFNKLQCALLEAVGRHALAVYIIHQPILLVLSGAAFI